MKYDVLNGMSVKTGVFWNVAPCSVVDGCRRFEGIVVTIYRVTWQNITFLIRNVEVEV